MSGPIIHPDPWATFWRAFFDGLAPSLFQRRLLTPQEPPGDLTRVEDWARVERDIRKVMGLPPLKDDGP